MSDRGEWSCEHCGCATRDLPTECDACKSSMCRECTDDLDDFGLCPNQDDAA